MSDVKIPENLLLEVAYSKRGVNFKRFKAGKFCEIRYIPRYVAETTFSDESLKLHILPRIKALTDAQKCGITVDVAKDSDGDTVIRVYGLPAETARHRVYADSYVGECDHWLRDFLYGLYPIRVFTAETARGELRVTQSIKDLWLKFFSEDQAEKVTVPSGWKIVTPENVHTLKNGSTISTMSSAPADGVHDEDEETDDEDDFDWDAHHEETGRLELRLLRAKVVKAEIEVAQAIRESAFYYYDNECNIVEAGKYARELLEDWG